MTPTERAVAQAMSKHGQQLPLDEITAETAMSQDALIDGIDVDEFICELERDFGRIVDQIPWGRFSDQRSSFRGCAVLLVPFWMVWRLIRRPFDGYWIPPPNGGDERLTVRHLAIVIDQGFWSEPEPSA